MPINRKLFAGIAIAVVFALPASAADKIKIGLITKFPVPFYSTMEQAAKKYAAAHPEIELVTGQGQAATDIEGQIALIESMITQGVKGLAVTPVDPTVAPALDKAVAAGIKVVLVDNSIPNWKGQTALVSTNNLNGGKIAGEYLKTVLKSGDKIGILQGVPGVPALDDRVTGMMQGLGDVKVDVVGKGATNCTLELGTSVTEDILTANPDLKAIYSACGPPIPGAVKSISNAGMANHKIILVGFDACCGEIEAIKSGAEDASVAQFPAKMGELGIDTVVKAIRGEAVDANVDTGAGLVTPQNVKDFE
ncbi:sugar ABC transporter substrate-binding protein [Mesorhizobium sp. B2-4-12]|uniref:sugar ABC transporter substrate-binding protein n=1 Tax=unclassified Mesorhizobium TaxID=325217 RepID=UPI00112B6C94|nr:MULTISPECIES: sugar ABC transporter substrate-binding protein [unclassified Mesorhizobium]TPK84493.1 sugar ABC transporter substrate-binding protein [Mesorhizobium sp. B2-4-17]TPK94613.1 sugar ABC transporter substrate-binding protein [Mesorhizobium sp. B2-4-12]TPL01945.1 sugar ABC transporter substrate-binding protein [Mesorhizobium sp. B2-4-14]UCI31686.1 sugar ABC transporter substrate-binding protein [Mesorhizobium sp. B4-1-4]